MEPERVVQESTGNGAIILVLVLLLLLFGAIIVIAIYKQPRLT